MYVLHMEEHFVSCQCSDFGHVFRLNFDAHDGDIYLDVRIDDRGPWHKRLINAFKYLFKINVAYGHYDVTMLKIEDYDRIRDLLNRSELVKAAQLSREREQRLLRG